MQQYIYGNIGGTGYTYVSSLPAFFDDPKHRQKLSPLVNYDITSKHGELPPTKHQCVWMLTTNLNDQAEPDRLYMQATGFISERAALYAQGYMSDGEGPAQLYGPQMMQLLKTAFGAPEAIEEQLGALSQEDTLRAVSMETLPKLDIKPARLDDEILRAVVMAVLEEKLVILRLSSTGAEAMEEARAVILAIYQRIPRERRRTCGFLTGASRGMLSGSKPLPGAVRMIVMDRDVNVTGLTSSAIRPFVDLSGEYPCKTIPRYHGEKEFPYVPLLDFLVQAPPENVEQFFAFCQDILQNEPNGRNPSIQQYVMLFSVYNLEQLNFDEAQLYNWAVSLYDNTWSPQMKELLYDKISSKLSEQTMEGYLCGLAGQYQDIFKLGVLETDDINHSKTARRDQNAALTLQMIGLLKTRYPGDLEQHLSRALAGRYVELACQAYPELSEANPTAITIQSLQQIRLPEENALAVSLAAQARQEVCRQLKQLCADRKARYQYNRDQQYTRGLRQIDAWFANGGDSELEALYQELCVHYLWQELLKDTCPESWNNAIAQHITAFCEANGSPESVEACSGLIERIKGYTQAFASWYGSFTQEQEHVIGQAETAWNKALSLSRRSCGDMIGLLGLFDEISAQHMAPSLAGTLKMQAAAAMVRKGITWEQLGSGMAMLGKRTAMSNTEREALRSVVAACPDMTAIPTGLSTEQIEQRLSVCETLTTMRLHNGTVEFPAWKLKEDARRLHCQLETLLGYRRGNQEPVWSSREMKYWAVSNLSENADLMLLLARDEWKMRKEILTQMAQNQHITADHIQALYQAGCTRRQLRVGAGEKTSFAWQHAVEQVFPAWPELPPPLEQPEPCDELPGIAVVHGTALGVVALVPLLAMLLTGLTGKIVCLTLIGIVSVFMAICLIAAAVSRRKGQKQYLLIAGFSLLPELLAAIGILLMNVLK